jgi:hypothetical protein
MALRWVEKRWPGLGPLIRRRRHVQARGVLVWGPTTAGWSFPSSPATEDARGRTAATGSLALGPTEPRLRPR